MHGTVTPTFLSADLPVGKPAQRQAAGAYWLNTIDPDYVNDPSIDPDVYLLIPPDGPTKRVPVAVDPADYTLDAIFGHAYFGLGSWRPALISTITSQPVSQSVYVGDQGIK